jgi:hypothetical protein
MPHFSSLQSRLNGFVISRIAKHNARHGVFPVEIRSCVGLGAKLEWSLEILAYCHERGLIPQFKFTYPNSQSSDDHFGRCFGIKGVSGEVKSPFFIKIASITELSLGKDYDRILTIELASFLLNKYLVIKDDVLSEVEQFWWKHFATKKVLGVHYRGTDKGEESPLLLYDNVFKNIDRYLTLHPDTDCIFTASDDMNFIEAIEKASIARPIVYRNDSFRARDGKPIHKAASIDNYEVTRDAIVNCLLLSRCDALLKTASILSGWSKLFNPKLPVVVLNQPYEQWFPERDLIRENLFVPVL